MTLALLIVSSLLLIYTYAGYPLLLWVLGRTRKASSVVSSGNTDWPFAALVVPIHNAASVLPEKLGNIESLSYPGDFSVEFVLDGCDDNSLELINAHRSASKWRINTHVAEDRNGKEAALRQAIPKMEADILVFSDADASFQPNTVTELVRALQDESIGVACGQEVHSTSKDLGAGEGEGLFYKYENLIKRLQSQVSSMTYVQGGVFAMRKELYPFHLKPGCTQDGLIAFNSVLHGKKVRHVATAISEESYDISTGRDFSRRIRTVCRAFYSIVSEPRIFLPWRAGTFGFHVFSHRVLRWFTVPLLIAVFGLTVALLNQYSFAKSFLVLQICFYVAAVLGAALESAKRRVQLAYICYYFLYLHMAAFIAVSLVLMGRRVTTWKPTATNG